MSKYFIVTDKKLTDEIRKFSEDRAAALKARHDFAKKNFNGFHEIHHYEGRRWGVTYKADNHGVTRIPEYMKFDKEGMCIPLKKTPKGKKIAMAMDMLPELIGAGRACEILRLQRFQFIGSGLVSVSPGLELIKHGKHNGRYLLSMHEDVKFDGNGCERIADTEAESILKPKRKAASK